MERDDETTLSETSDSQQGPSPHGWKYIFAFFAFLVITVFILTLYYREMPKESGIVERRTEPATNGVFTVVLSPLEAEEAQRIARSIAADIDKDSAQTRMVVGGTAVYKECSSLKDYGDVITHAIVNARQRDLRTQAVLLSQVTGRIIINQVPTRLYLIGSFAGTDFETIAVRIAGAANRLQTRRQLSSLYGDIEMVAFGSSQAGDSLHGERQLYNRVLDNFRERGISVSLR